MTIAILLSKRMVMRESPKKSDDPLKSVRAKTKRARPGGHARHVFEKAEAYFGLYRCLQPSVTVLLHTG